MPWRTKTRRRAKANAEGTTGGIATGDPVKPEAAARPASSAAAASGEAATAGKATGADNSVIPGLTRHLASEGDEDSKLVTSRANYYPGLRRPASLGSLGRLRTAGHELECGVAWKNLSSDKRYPALVTALLAVLGFPFYLGLVHLPVAQLAIYSGVASTAMATGQYADTPSNQRGGMGVFLTECGLWFLLVAAGGGLAYLIALIF